MLRGDISRVPTLPFAGANGEDGGDPAYSPADEGKWIPTSQKASGLA